MELTQGFKLIVKEGRFKGFEFPLTEGENLIGRWDPESGSLPDVDLEQFDEEAKVSRLHAKIIIDGKRVMLEDLSSQNGTYVNFPENRLQPGLPCSLQLGDNFQIGQTIFKLVAVG